MRYAPGQIVTHKLGKQVLIANLLPPEQEEKCYYEIRYEDANGYLQTMICEDAEIE